MTAVIMFIQQRGRYGRPVPKWARRVFFHCLPRLLCMYVPEKLATETNEENTVRMGSKEKNKGLRFPVVHFVSKEKFHILFLNYVFQGKDIMGEPLIGTSQYENAMSPTGSFYPTNKPLDIDDLVMTVELKEKNNGLSLPVIHFVSIEKFHILFLNYLFQGKVIMGEPLLATSQYENVMSPTGSFYATIKPLDIDDLVMMVELRKIREEIRKLRDDTGDSEKEHRIECEWEYLTAVLDRLLLFVFSMAVLIVTGVLLIVGNANVQY